MLRPLGNRILIRPEPAQDKTESGLWIAEQKKPDQTGTVVAVGVPVHPKRDEAIAAAEWLDDQGDRHIEVADLLRALVRRHPIVQVGDVVVFSWQSGQELTVDGERFLLMPEDDLLAVLEGV